MRAARRFAADAAKCNRLAIEPEGRQDLITEEAQSSFVIPQNASSSAFARAGDRGLARRSTLANDDSDSSRQGRSDVAHKPVARALNRAAPV